MPGEARTNPKGQAPAFLKHSVRKPAGYYVATGPGGVEDEGETLMCVHCQCHWQVKPGSGRRRGFCFNCAGPTCGAKPCEASCVPFEKALEISEARGRLTEKARRNAGF